MSRETRSDKTNAPSFKQMMLVAVCKDVRLNAVDISLSAVRSSGPPGFKWRKARVIRTRKDPHDREKVARITSVLSNLRPKERFFLIDALGPFAIKKHSGLVLCDPKQVAQDRKAHPPLKARRQGT
jgi:hypothetical protein